MTILQRITISMLRFYQHTLSPDHGWVRRPTCRYQPTCSDYAIDAITAYGVLRGGWKAVRRIARCHPFAKQQFDPIS